MTARGYVITHRWGCRQRWRDIGTAWVCRSRSIVCRQGRGRRESLRRVLWRPRGGRGRLNKGNTDERGEVRDRERHRPGRGCIRRFQRVTAAAYRRGWKGGAHVFSPARAVRASAPRHDPAELVEAVPCLDTASDGHYLPMRARPSTPQTMIMTDTDTDTLPIPTADGDKPDRESTCVKPTLTAVSLGSAVQLQLRLDSDDNDHDGDDEQDYNREDDDPERSLTCSRSHSPVPLGNTPTPPARQQQLQSTPTSTTTPTTGPFTAHVHFHSRVRITSGLRHSRGNRTLGDSSDSDSPSSSISAPLHYHSRSTVPRLPLGERVSRLASQALQKRRIAAATSTTTSSPRRFRTRDHHEYTPFLRAGVPVTYGTAQRGYSQVGDDVEGENASRPNGMHREDGIAFRRWLSWRALNRQVSSALRFISDSERLRIIPLSGGSGRSNQLCVVVAILMSLTATNDRINRSSVCRIPKVHGAFPAHEAKKSSLFFALPTQIVMLYYTEVFVSFHWV